MNVSIRQVRLDDLDAVTRVEAVCFPQAEAATRDSFLQRIQTFPESFLIGEKEGAIIGFINGCVTDDRTICDEMFDTAEYHRSEGAWQAVFGLDVVPQWQHRGVASQLMKALIQKAAEAGRKGLILTCKENLIGFYESFGYRNTGVSASAHGGAVWYDMMLEL